VIGVTIFGLQRKYQKHRVKWEELREDLMTGDESEFMDRGLARLTREMDLESAVRSCSSLDRALFRLIYIEQRDPPGICEALDVSEGAYYARKTRLLQRLRASLDVRTDLSPERRRC